MGKSDGVNFRLRRVISRNIRCTECAPLTKAGLAMAKCTSSRCDGVRHCCARRTTGNAIITPVAFALATPACNYERAHAFASANARFRDSPRVISVIAETIGALGRRATAATSSNWWLPSYAPRLAKRTLLRGARRPLDNPPF